MREVTFIKQNAQKWEKFESLVKSRSDISADELSDLYLGLQDDLAYARTFYPKSNTAKYLNELTAHFHRAIYRNKRESTSRVITFWKYEVPYAVLKSHKQIGYAAIIFIVSFVIGGISAMHDDEFVRLIVGDRYVNMTLRNIENGDPMAVYKSSGEGAAFLLIGPNNIKVSFMSFVGGITAGLLTIYVLFFNGIMVGSLQYLFYQKGFFLTSALALYLHGTLELSAIVIAGGAGLVLAGSILFPGTYSRRDSAMEGAKRGLKIVIGIVPVLIVADFIESFVTRHYDTMALQVRVSIVLVSLIFIIWYFIVYPIQLKNKLYGSTTQNSSTEGS